MPSWSKLKIDAPKWKACVSCSTFTSVPSGAATSTVASALRYFSMSASIFACALSFQMLQYFWLITERSIWGPAHAAVAKNAAALTDAAQTEAERKDAWQQAEELWLQAVNDLYSECLLAASQEHRVMLVRNQYAFQSYLNAYEKALKTAYGLDGQAVCERLCAALTARVVDLCYVAHHAPERRPDSLLSGSVRPLTADAAARCALVRGKAAANRFTSTETLCESHAAPEEALRQALSLAAGADAQADAFGNAESAYRNLISALATALGRSLPRQAQRELMMYGSAAGSFFCRGSSFFSGCFSSGSRGSGCSGCCAACQCHGKDTCGSK